MLAELRRALLGERGGATSPGEQKGWLAPAASRPQLQQSSRMIHDARDVIEPSDGKRVAEDKRGDVHTLWQTDEYRNV